MARVAVIGDPVQVSGYGLAGAVICPAADREQAHAAWRQLPPDVAVVVLTAEAAGWLAAALGPRPVTDGSPAGGLPRRPDVLPVVLPPARPAEQVGHDD